MAEDRRKEELPEEPAPPVFDKKQRSSGRIPMTLELPIDQAAAADLQIISGTYCSIDLSTAAWSIRGGFSSSEEARITVQKSTTSDYVLVGRAEFKEGVLTITEVERYAFSENKRLVGAPLEVVLDVAPFIRPFSK